MKKTLKTHLLSAFLPPDEIPGDFFNGNLPLPEDSKAPDWFKINCVHSRIN